MASRVDPRELNEEADDGVMRHFTIRTPGRAPPAGILDQIATGRTLALVVRGFIPASVRRSLVESMSGSIEPTTHPGEPDLTVLGLSHFQARTWPQQASAYVASTETRSTWLLAGDGDQAIMDQALRYVGGLHPHGVERMNLPTEGFLAPFTLRFFNPGAKIDPHRDVLAEESPTDPVARSIGHQFAVNLYLEADPDGGHIVFHPDPEFPVTAWAHPRMVTLGPRPGDLIVMSSCRTHSVTAVREGRRRVTLSFFLAQVGGDQPLRYWA